MTERDEETEVRKLMGEISRAFIERDVETLAAIFDDDFTLSEPTGDVVSKQQWLADVASGDLAVESVQSNAFDIRRVGDSYRVRGELTLRARYSKSNYNGTFGYMGVYAKQGDRWKLVLSSARRVPPADSSHSNQISSS
jgi:ketosteroid isomerase-like protein